MFPEWIKKEKDDVFSINADIGYPILLKELRDSIQNLTIKENLEEFPWITKLRELDLDNLTQYWIEVVYQMAKLELRRILLLNSKNAWPKTIIINGDKKKWGIENYPKGHGINAATKGREAREHYKRLKGFIPG